MRWIVTLTAAICCGLLSTCALAAAEPAETIRQAEQVLGELMAAPDKQIPERLLADAQGLAIIPRVIKIGFVAGGRRGHGVAIVRDAAGEWTLPQFVTLTGGSVGWQAGIQGTDVVLVFTTRKGVEGLMSGKFTVGVDASATAGPVGRNAAAATDSALKAEILSYSRSRGLFLGVSIDGSALEIDQSAYTAFYGLPNTGTPQRIPESAVRLRQYLVGITKREPTSTIVAQQPATVGPQPSGATVIQPPSAQNSAALDPMRAALAERATRLHALVSPDWQRYLAIPQEVFQPGGQPNLAALTASQERFARIEHSKVYSQLVQRPEYQATYAQLRAYVAALSPSQPTLQLAPPPRGNP